MGERKCILLLLYLFHVCQGIITREKSFNQKLDMYVLNSKYESLIKIPSEKRT